MQDSRPVKIIGPPELRVRVLIKSVSTLCSYGGLLYTLILHRIKVRYKQSMLGWFWAALQPLSLMLIYTAVFSIVAGIKTDELPYPLFAFSGLLPWVFFSSAISGSTAGMVAHRVLLSRVYFPRELIPLSYVAAAFIDFAVAFFILGGLMVYYGVPITAASLLAIPIMVLVAVCATAAALCLAALEARFRDVGIALPLLLQLGMLACPIVYPMTAVPADLRSIYVANPLAILIDDFRLAVVVGSVPGLPGLVYCAVVSVCCLVVSYAVFKTLEPTMVDMI